jgi:hypothetical protein
MSDKDATPNADGQVDDDKGQTDDDAGQTDDDDSAGDDDDDGNAERIVFESQDELDAVIERRLKRDRRKRNAKKAVDKAADKADKSSDDDAGAATRDADAKIAKAQRIAASAEAMIAASSAGLVGERAKAAAKLADLDLDVVIDEDGEVDEDAVAEAVEAAIETYPFLKAEDAPAEDDDDNARTRRGRVGGKTKKRDGDKSETAVSKEQFDKMGYYERVQLRNRDPQLYQELAGVA